jgi:hypothetical protein
LLENLPDFFWRGYRRYLYVEATEYLGAEDFVDFLCRININEEESASSVSKEARLLDFARFHHPLNVRSHGGPNFFVGLRTSERVEGFYLNEKTPGVILLFTIA